MLKQPRDADRDRVRLVVTFIGALADKLRQRLGDDVLLGKLVIGNKFLDGLRMNLVKDATAERPSIQIGDTDNLVQHFNNSGTARACLLIKGLFSDDNRQRISRQVAAQLMGNLREDLPVRLAGALVIDIACLLYLYGSAAWEIAQIGKSRSPEGEVTCDDILVCRNLLDVVGYAEEIIDIL